MSEITEVFRNSRNVICNHPGKTDLIAREVETNSDKFHRLRPIRKSRRLTETLKFKLA